MMFYLLFALVAVVCVRLSTTAPKHIVNETVYMLAALRSKPAGFVLPRLSHRTHAKTNVTAGVPLRCPRTKQNKTILFTTN